MKRVVIVGATSGIGREVAKECLLEGWKIGIAGRRLPALEAFRSDASGDVEIQIIDVTSDTAVAELLLLIEKMGGMDLFFLSSGVGYRNLSLDPQVELDTVRTNAEGFVRMVSAAFDYFKKKGGGHIAVISSIAGTKGLGAAPAYSATKKFQNTYIDALSQLSRMEKLNIRFTDIRPGFVATELLKGGDYPLLMNSGAVARHIVHALKREKRVMVIDFRYAILVFFWKLIPRFIWERMPVK